MDKPGNKRKSRSRQRKELVTQPTVTPEEAALQERCHAWYARITEHCGGPMTKGGQVINEHKSVKSLCQKYSDAQIKAIFTYLTTRDWKWSKIDNKFNVRAYVIWEESGRVAQILKEQRLGKSQQPPSDSLEPPVIIRPASSVRSFNGIAARQQEQRLRIVGGSHL